MAETRLGPLEERVLDALWTRGCPCSVRDLHPLFPAVAYTTLMTTMDRLHRKGVLAREKHGETATCNSGGAGKWPVPFREHFRDAIVTVVQ